MNSQSVQFSEAQQRDVDRLTLQWVEILCRVDRDVNGPEVEEMEMAFDEDWITRPDGTVHIAVVDSETTSLDPGTAEVIGLCVLCVRVDRACGQMLSVVGPHLKGRSRSPIHRPPRLSQVCRQAGWGVADSVGPGLKCCFRNPTWWSHTTLGSRGPFLNRCFHSSLNSVGPVRCMTSTGVRARRCRTPPSTCS